MVFGFHPKGEGFEPRDIIRGRDITRRKKDYSSFVRDGDQNREEENPNFRGKILLFKYINYDI